MNSITIKLLNETHFTYEDIAELLHSAFRERLNQGLVYTSSRMTSDDYKRQGDNGIVLVAVDPELNTLIGTAMVHICQDEKGVTFGEMEHVGVALDSKRKGVGSSLVKELTRISIAHGADYIRSDTAAKAKSAVSWHLKNGFFKWELISFPSTSYYSILFRKQTTYDLEWNKPLQQKAHFYISCFRTILGRKKNGCYRNWVKLIKKSYNETT
ncbi:MAG: GNAT family N-acetyltransferase [Bacteroidales bacterium]|nr:GNAT family N-acetyltransferase [Bacteroidales bacterium]